MELAPLANITIYRGIPLDPTFDHTLFFASTNAQTAYFLRSNNKVWKHQLTRQMYQRVSKGKMRVQIPADQLYDCNYLSFKNPIVTSGQTAQNTQYTKTFYCFITDVEYVNNEVSEITYQIDPMQTWLPNVDYTLLDCFIEREHSETDVIGDNLVPETVELGEYVTNSAPSGTFTGTTGEQVSDMKIVIASTFDSNYDDRGGNYISGMFSGLIYNVFDNTANGVNLAVNFIDGAVSRQKQNGIVAVFMAPSKFIHIGGDARRFSITVLKDNRNFGNYLPHNKKLYTYPYRFLKVINNQGEEHRYAYEYFENNNCEFFVGGDYTADPTIILAPQNYKMSNLSSSNTTNFSEMISLRGWPQCAFNTDTFKAWLAQTASTLPFTIAQTGWGAESMNIRADTMLEASRLAGNGAFNGGLIATSAMPELSLLNGASKVAGIISEGVQAYRLANQPHGTPSNTVMAALGLMDFGFYTMSIREEFAKIIDGYFDMYGYACRKVKQPNISVRPKWNYTKTVGCKIANAYMPASMEKTICDIFDHGITFWKDPDGVGIYNGLANKLPGT